MQNTENKVFEVFSSPGSFIPLFFPWKMMYGQDIYFFRANSESSIRIFCRFLLFLSVNYL